MEKITGGRKILGANRYEAESKLRRIATKFLVTAIRNFNRKIIR